MNKLIVMDGGNFILDCFCGVILDVLFVVVLFLNIFGVVEYGLFINLVCIVIIGVDDGVIIFEY